MRPRHRMVDGDLDSAEAVTHTRYAEIQSDGTTIIKQVLEIVGFYAPTCNSTAA